MIWVTNFFLDFNDEFKKNRYPICKLSFFGISFFSLPVRKNIGKIEIIFGFNFNRLKKLFNFILELQNLQIKNKK